ncbi:hypothetical protein WDW89_04070 [Deltaproteobacteria bacterium TL4]
MLETLNPGDIYGEQAYLDGTPSLFKIDVLEDAEVYPFEDPLLLKSPLILNNLFFNPIRPTSSFRQKAASFEIRLRLRSACEVVP